MVQGDRIREWCAQRSHDLPVPSTNLEFVPMNTADNTILIHLLEEAMRVVGKIKRALIDRGFYDEKNFAWMRQQKMEYIAPGKGGTDISEFAHALSDTNYHGKRMPDRGYQPKTERGKRAKMARDAKINRKDETVKKEPFEGEKEVIHFWITNRKTVCDALLSRRYCPGARQEVKSEVL